MTTESKGRILVVDDEEAVRQSIAIVLSQSGFEPVLAADVPLALAEHARARCDLLLVDKNLPGESGIDLIQHLRDAGDDVPAIVMTAFGSVESAIVGLHLHIAAYVEKPFDDIFAVSTLVDRALREHRRRVSAGTAIKHFRRAQAALHDATAAHTGRSLRVMIAGSRADREAVVKWLARPDDVVEHHLATVAALAAVAKVAPDLAVMEMTASEPDVFGAVEQIHATAPQAWCVVVASHPSLSDVVRLIGLDTRAILERPLDERQIRERLGPLVEQLRQKG